MVATLSRALGAARHAAVRALGRADGHLRALAETFDWVYRSRARGRRERMKRRRLAGAEDRVLLGDFLALLRAWGAATREFAGWQEAWAEMRRVYKWR